MLLPTLLFVCRFPVRLWASPTFAPMAAMATLMALYMVDCLLNGFINLILVVASGGLICAVPSDSKRRASVDDFSEGEPLARPLRPRSGPPEANSSRAMLTDSSAQLTDPESPAPHHPRNCWPIVTNDLPEPSKSKARVPKPESPGSTPSIYWPRPPRSIPIDPRFRNNDGIVPTTLPGS